MATNRAEFKIRESPGVVATAGRTNYQLDGVDFGGVRTLNLSSGPNIDILSGGDLSTLTLTISADYTTMFQINSGTTVKRNILNLVAGENMQLLQDDDGDTLTVELSSLGAQGPQGYQGHQGDQGYQGYIGDQGPQGISGTQGFQGVSGTGPQGVQGHQGEIGDRGYQGPSGGAQGDQGHQGGIGDTGATGPAGSDMPGPTVVKTITAANTFRPGDIIRYDGANYVKSMSNNSVSATAIGIVSSATTSEFDIVTHGYIDSLSGVTYANETRTTFTTDITGVITMSMGQGYNDNGTSYRILFGGDFYPQVAGGNGTLSGDITYPAHPALGGNIGDFGGDDAPPLTDTFTGTFSSPSLTALDDEAGVYVEGKITGKNANNLNDYLITDIDVRGYIDIGSFGTGQLHLTAFDWPTHIVGLQPGEIYYLSNTSLGEATSSVPTTLDHYVKPVMYAVSFSSAFVNIQSSIKITTPETLSTNSNVHTVTLTSHDFNVGTPIYYDGTTYRASNCTTGSAAEVLGIIQSTTNDTFTYVSDGSITFDTNYFSMAPGSIYFLGPLSGQLATSEPTHEGHISKPILYAISDSTGLVKNYRGITISGLTGPVPAIQTNEDHIARNNVLLLWMEHAIRDSLINGEAQDGDHDVFITNTVHGLTPRVEKIYEEQTAPGAQTTLSDSYTAVYPTLGSGLSIDAVYDPTLDLYHNARKTLYRHVFKYYGSDKNWTVPTGLDSTVTQISAHMWGAGGGGGGANNVASLLAFGGPGGYTSGTVPVTGGETLTMIIGRAGRGSTNTSGGPNLSGEWQETTIEYGGGAKATTINAAGGGGGRTAIRRGSTELITAGGGGGAGTGDDGRGGGGNGGTGFDSNSAVGGGGGTLTEGGSAGADSYDATPLSGTQFTGGAHSTDAFGGAGGGGGYYGGGAGAAHYGVNFNAGGGGGGSGYNSGTNTIILSSSTTTPPNSSIEQRSYDTAAGIGGDRGATGGDGLAVVEYETLVYTNMVITSEPVSAIDIPTKSRVVLLYKPEVDTTLNTDVKLFVSRNNGANWEETILSYEGMYNENYQIIAGTGDVADHDTALTDYDGLSGTVMRWKIQTYNNKYQKVRGVAQMWS